MLICLAISAPLMLSHKNALEFPGKLTPNVKGNVLKKNRAVLVLQYSWNIPCIFFLPRGTRYIRNLRILMIAKPQSVQHTDENLLICTKMIFCVTVRKERHANLRNLTEYSLFSEERRNRVVGYTIPNAIRFFFILKKNIQWTTDLFNVWIMIFPSF